MNIAEYVRLGRQGGALQLSKVLLLKVHKRLFARNKVSRPARLKLKYLDHPVYIRLSTSDWASFDKVLLVKEYDEPSPAHARQLSRFYEECVSMGRRPIIVDCGANIGMSAIWYATRFPLATVFALEPVPDNYELLVRNTHAYPNIVPRRVAVSGRRQTLKLMNTDAQQAANAWQTRPDGDGEAVEVVTIADVTATITDGALIVVKIDIEGHELELLGEAADWVSRAPLIVIELHDWLQPWRGSGHAVYSRLAQSGARDYVQSGENMFSYSRALLLPDTPAP